MPASHNQLTFKCSNCNNGILEVRSQKDEFYLCPQCGHRYNVYFGIPDFRNFGDNISGGIFDINSDLKIASSLWQEYHNLSYNEFPVFLSRYSSKTRVNKAYKRFVDNYNKIESQTHLVHGEKILDKMFSYIDSEGIKGFDRRSLKQKIAFEAGCGHGQYVYGFAKEFNKIYVTDISYVCLLMAKKLAEENKVENAFFFCSNIENLPVSGNSFDFVHCNGVIEHVANPDKIARESRRVLKSGGVYLLLSPNKYPISVEPHFRVWDYGFWPVPLRLFFCRKFRGLDSFAGTDLFSLSRLKRLIMKYYGKDYRIFFLPRNLKSTARNTAMRKTVRKILSNPVTGRLLSLLINKLFIYFMPYHIALCFKKENKGHFPKNNRKVLPDG